VSTVMLSHLHTTTGGHSAEQVAGQLSCAGVFSSSPPHISLKQLLLDVKITDLVSTVR
jgi:hypothetical protein